MCSIHPAKTFSLAWTLLPKHVIKQKANNNELKIDFVLTAIGSIPNTSLAEQINLKVDNGICVNQYMQTSNPNIYAIGDCTNFMFNSNF